MGVDDLVEETPDKKYKRENWLREQYIEKDRSQTDIAEECGAGKTTIRYWINKLDLQKGRECPLCDFQSPQLGNHFSQTSHGHPDLTFYQKELLVGMIMGDGCHDNAKDVNDRLQLGMKNLEFVEWLSEELGWLAGEPSLTRTAEEGAIHNAFNETPVDAANPDNYNDMYRFYTVYHPWINKLDWVEDGDKKFRDDFKLTPTVAKIWYCGDGSLAWSENTSPASKIACTKSAETLEMLAGKFEDVLCRPTIYEDYGLRFTVEQTEQFLDWMGEAPPGFEYKWCTESREKYDRLKRESDEYSDKKDN